MADFRSLDAIAKHTQRCERLLFPENLGEPMSRKDPRNNKHNYPPWLYSSDSIEDKGSPDFLFHPDAFKKTRCRDDGRCRKPLHECPFLHMGEVFDPSWRYAGVMVHSKLKLPNIITYDLFKFLVLEYHSIARGKCNSTLHEMRSQRDRCDKYHSEEDQRNPVRYNREEGDWMPYPAGASKSSFERNFHPMCYKVRLCPKVEKGKPCRHDRHCTSYHSEEERKAVVGYWKQLRDELLGAPLAPILPTPYLLAPPAIQSLPLPPVTVINQSAAAASMKTGVATANCTEAAGEGGSKGGSGGYVTKPSAAAPATTHDMAVAAPKENTGSHEGRTNDDSAPTSTSSFSDEELDEMMRSCSSFAAGGLGALSQGDPADSNGLLVGSPPSLCQEQVYMPTNSFWSCPQSMCPTYANRYCMDQGALASALGTLSPLGRIFPVGLDQGSVAVTPCRYPSRVQVKLGGTSFSACTSRVTFRSVSHSLAVGVGGQGAIKTWSVDDVCRWAMGHSSSEVQQVADMFRANDIDGCVLSTMTEFDLKEIGLDTLGRRRRVMIAIDGLIGR